MYILLSSGKALPSSSVHKLVLLLASCCAPLCMTKCTSSGGCTASYVDLVWKVQLLSLHNIFSFQLLRPCLHGNGAKCNRTGTLGIGLALTRKLMEPFHTKPLAVPERLHLESRSCMEPNQNVLVLTIRTVLVRYA